MSPSIPSLTNSAGPLQPAERPQTAPSPAPATVPAPESSALAPEEALLIAQLPGKRDPLVVDLTSDGPQAAKAEQKSPTGKVKAEPKTQQVTVSAYGPGLYGNKTANGNRLSPATVGLAHKTLPMGTRVDVTINGKTVTGKVIDRGPFVAGRTFDLTAGLIKKLGFASCDVFGIRKVLVRIHR